MNEFMTQLQEMEVYALLDGYVLIYLVKQIVKPRVEFKRLLFKFKGLLSRTLFIYERTFAFVFILKITRVHYTVGIISQILD